MIALIFTKDRIELIVLPIFPITNPTSVGAVWIVKIILPEDIILLKCATEREKDRDVGEKMMEDRLKSEEIIKTTRFG